MDTTNGSHVPESHRDLLGAPFVTLATVGPTGRPQLSTVCFLASGNGTVQLSVNATRQKSRNIHDNPKVALHILDTTNPSRYLERDCRGSSAVTPPLSPTLTTPSPINSAPSTATSICARWTDPASTAPW